MWWTLEPSTKPDGRFASAETALVYQLSGDWGWANFSGGPRVTDVRLSPRDPSNDRRGTRLDLALQSDGAVQIDRSWRLGWLGSVGWSCLESFALPHSPGHLR